MTGHQPRQEPRTGVSKPRPKSHQAPCCAWELVRDLGISRVIRHQGRRSQPYTVQAYRAGNSYEGPRWWTIRFCETEEEALGVCR